MPSLLHHLEGVRLGAAVAFTGPDTYIPDAASQLDQLLIGYYACFALMLLALLFYRLVNGRRLGRILRMAPEKREGFAEATGVNFRQARVWVFVISSIALGFIGGFYAANFRGVAFSIFNFDTVLLGLAMLVIGGIGRAEGAVRRHAQSWSSLTKF